MADGERKANKSKEKKKFGFVKKTKRKSVKNYSKLSEKEDDDDAFEVGKIGKKNQNNCSILGNGIK